MPEFGFDLGEVSRLVRLVEERGFARLVVADGERSVEIHGCGQAVRDGQLGPAVSAGAVSHKGPATDWIPIESPMVGVFYRAASPDAPPLVEVGDHVEAGQPIGMIEAMKVFSEVPSDHSGIVAEIAAKNSELVHQGQPLLYLKPE